MANLFVRAAVLLVVLTTAFAHAGIAQSRQLISGTVSDTLGRPLAGVRIVETRSGTRVTSQDDGRFRIALPFSKDAELFLSRIGFAPITLRVDSIASIGRSLGVRMQPIPYRLDDIQVRRARSNEPLFGVLVLDEAGMAVSGVEFTIAGFKRAALTDSAGFLQTAVKRGGLIVRGRKRGYRAFFGSFTVHADRIDTIRMAVLADSSNRELLSGFGRDTFALLELHSRTSWRTHDAVTVTREDLNQSTGSDLCSALEDSRANRGQNALRLDCSRPMCVLVNGERAVLRPLTMFDAGEVEAVEIFPQNADYSGTIYARASMTCYPNYRQKVGPGRNPGGIVVWLKHTRQ